MACSKCRKAEGLVWLHSWPQKGLMVLGNRSLSSALIDTWTDAYWRWPLIERLPTAEVAVVAALAVIVVVAAVVTVITAATMYYK